MPGLHTKPNILVIVLDTVRPDYVRYGQPGFHTGAAFTPNIDGLAAQGVWCDAAFSEYPITVPARTAMVTGRYTWPERPWGPLRGADVSFVELLRDAGYATAAFSDSPFAPGAGMDRGFGHFRHFALGKCRRPDLSPEEYRRRMAAVPPADFPDVMPEADRLHYHHSMVNRQLAMEQYGRACPDLLFEAAVDWLQHEAPQRKPWFLWVDSFEPHEPWCPPEPYRGRYDSGHVGRYLPMPMGPESDWMAPEELEHVRNLYRASLTQTDEQVGRLLAALDLGDLFRSTLVVLLSDHGMPFGEHGTIRKFNVPVYEELARIVQIWRWPAEFGEGVRTAALAQNVDLAPTLLGAAGLPLHPRMQGYDLQPLLRGQTERIRRYAYLGAFQMRAAIRTEEWKFIDNQGEGPNELYHLATDPQERDNRAAVRADLAAEMHGELWRFRTRWADALAWRDRPVVTR